VQGAHHQAATAAAAAAAVTNLVLLLCCCLLLLSNTNTRYQADIRKLQARTVVRWVLPAPSGAQGTHDA
jgi:hypothetical protein